jgi:hypothetical protein
MADETPGSGERREEPPRTPFDNPFFLPVMLWIFAVWFGYDGWLNADEHMLEPSTLWFNRIGFPIALLLALWFTRRGLRERRLEREREGNGAAK